MTSKRTKRLGSLLLTLVMVLSLSSMFCFTTAFAESDGDWKYKVENGRAIITDYIGTGKTITVPATVNGISVSKVEALSRTNKGKVTSITFSEGITEIGASLCNGYTALEVVTLPKSLTKIGASAFNNCSSLRGITLPSSLNSIGEYAFQSCYSLNSATLNCSVSVIPAGLFNGCSQLGNISIPSTCTEIGDNAFSGCTKLANINLPNSVKTIGNNAFLNCSGFKGEFVLPSEIKTIGEFAFSGCSGITDIIIPNKIKKIGESAFSNCTSLTRILIGNSLSNLGDKVFAGCKQLEKIVFGGKNNSLSGTSSALGDVNVYYPSNLADSWASFGAVKKTSYAAPKSVTIKGDAEMTANSKQTLKITVSPNTSVIGKCYYLTTSNPSVATVDANGLVTSKAGGKATITATTINGVTETFEITVQPAKVTNVDAVSQTTSSVQVSWKATENVTGYIIYRSTKKSSGFKKVGTSLTNSYTDKGLTKGKTYYYRVKAYSNVNGDQITSANSATVSIKVSAPTPTTVSAKKSKSKVAQIKWSKSIGAQGYQIYMASSKNGKFSEIKTITSGSTLSFKKTGLKSGKTYYFKVRPYITVDGKKVFGEFTKVVSCKV